eukprot:4293403-Pyramimonas_sp.AAC.1
MGAVVADGNYTKDLRPARIPPAVSAGRPPGGAGPRAGDGSHHSVGGGWGDSVSDLLRPRQGARRHPEPGGVLFTFGHVPKLHLHVRTRLVHQGAATAAEGA